MAPRFPWLKNILTQNLGLKLLSLILAIFTFHAIRTTTSDEEAFIIPVEPELEDGTELLAQEPLSVTVTVRGAREDLKRLDSKYMKVVLKPEIAGPDRLEIRPRDVRGVSGMRVVNVDPAWATFTLGRLAPAVPETNRDKRRETPAPKEKPVFDQLAWSNVTVLAVGEPGTVATVFFEPPIVKVTASGMVEALARLNNTPPMVFVNCSDITSSEPVDRPVQSSTQVRGITIVTDPNVVRVSLKEKEDESRGP